MSGRAYASPEAFKQALEQRLRNASNGAADLARRRQLLVFDRFLARVVAIFQGSIVLKGGLVLEIRLDRARMTRDIDLRLTGPADDVLTRLQEAGRLNLDDFFAFKVEPDPSHPDIQNEGMRYEGQRFRAECRLAGKVYGQRFGIDVAVGDPLLSEPEVIVARDILDFAGIAPPKLLVYPIETHIAEKLHAYTLPRTRPSSRVKDLPDMALLASVGSITASRLVRALEVTFSFRATHALPSGLPEPEVAWDLPYARLARENQLPWASLAEVTSAVRAFLDPVLAGGTLESWHPDPWTWRTV